MESTARESYAEWLSRNMDERQITVRHLARLLNPENPEIARRSVRRYLRGMVPQERTRQEIASKLGTTEIGPVDDAEEDRHVDRSSAAA